MALALARVEKFTGGEGDRAGSTATSALRAVCAVRVDAASGWGAGEEVAYQNHMFSDQ